MWRPCLIVAAALAASCGFTQAQEPGGNVPARARQEILRRGDLVTRHGDGVRGLDDLLAAAYGPPADDSSKWFVSIISTTNCTHCARLVADWKRSPELLAWANPDDPEQSWAHWNQYRWNDTTQAWRFKGLKVDGFPTVIVQPPRSRKFGDPSIVVFQGTGYDGDPKKLAAKMSGAVRMYVERLSRQPQTVQPAAEPTIEPARQSKQAGFGQDQGFGQAAGPEAHGQSPPFTPIGPNVDPVNPFSIPPVIGPQPATLDQLMVACPNASADFLLTQMRMRATVEQAQMAWRLQGGGGQPGATPTPAPVPGLPDWLGIILAVLGVSNLGGLIVLALSATRALRKAQGAPLFLDDAQFEKLKQAVAELVSKPKPA